VAALTTQIEEVKTRSKEFEVRCNEFVEKERKWTIREQQLGEKIYV
jgi:hypothetical protein